MITKEQGIPQIGQIKGMLSFTTETPITLHLTQNTTKATVQVQKYDTGKYMLTAYLESVGIFKSGTAGQNTMIYPLTSDWGTMPLSKTTVGDYSYHWAWIHAGRLDLVCQKSSDISYQDFTAVAESLNLWFAVDIINY